MATKRKRIPRTKVNEMLPPSIRRTLDGREKQYRKLAAEAEEARVKRVRDDLASARRWADERPTVEATLRAAQSRVGLIEATRNRGLAVIRSFGLSVPVNVIVTKGHKAELSGVTDFKQIKIQFPQRFVPAVENGTLKNQDKLNDLLGLMYHEAGHLRFSPSFPQLVVESHPKDFNITKDVLVSDKPADVRLRDTLYRDIQALGSNHPVLGLHGHLHHAWNILEDQRMETLVVEDAPIVSKYFTSLCGQHMLRLNDPMHLWPLIAGRKFLPSKIRTMAENAFVMAGKGDPDVCAEIIDDYKNAATPEARYDAVVRFHEFLVNDLQTDPGDMTNGEAGRHQNEGETRPGTSGVPSSKPDSTERTRKPKPVPADEDEGDEDAEGGGMGEEDEDGEDADGPGEDGEGEGESGEGEAEGESNGGSTEGKGKGDKPGKAEAGRSKAAGDDAAPIKRGEQGAGDRDAEKSDAQSADPTSGSGGGGVTEPQRDNPLKTMEEIQSDIEDMLAETAMDFPKEFTSNVMAEIANPEGALEPLTTVDPLSDDFSDIGQSLAGPLEEALNAVTADLAPFWQRGQRNGVLNPIDYRTRKPGDLEFNRNYNDSGDPLLDVSVSLVLDMSISMAGRGGQVGAVDKGVYLACEALGVPYRSVIFGDPTNFRLLNSSERPPVFQECPTLGSTDPDGAMTALSRLDITTKHHLLITFTDGVFNSDWKGVTQYDWPENTHTICLVEGSGGPRCQTLGFDEVVVLENGLMEIPMRLERFLERFAA